MKSLIVGGLLLSMSFGVFTELKSSAAEDLLQQRTEKIIDRFFKDHPQLTLMDSVRVTKGYKNNADTAPLLREVKKYFSRGAFQPRMSSLVVDDLKLGVATLDLSRLSPTLTRAEKRALFLRAVDNYEKGKSLSGFFVNKMSRDYLSLSYKDLREVLQADAKDPYRKFVLYLLGDVGMQLWDENKDMAGVLCMIELIRSYPEDKLAKMAWVKINSQIHFGYTGSSGDNTPPEWIAFLDDLRVLAFQSEGGSVDKRRSLSWLSQFR